MEKRPGSARKMACQKKLHKASRLSYKLKVGGLSRALIRTATAMKTPILIAGLLLSHSLSTLAQVPGSVSNLVFNLTITETTEGTVQKNPETGKPITGKDDFGNPLGGAAFGNEWTLTKNDKDDNPVSELYRSEYVAKLRTEKYGNKELLTDLLDAELLPAIGGGAPSIAGWTIVEVTGTVENIDGQPEVIARPTFYAFHSASGVAVLLSGVVIAIDDEVRSGEAENWTEQYTRQTNFVKDTEVVTVKSGGSIKTVVRLVMDFSGVLETGDASASVAQFQGLYSQQEKLSTLTAPDKTKIQVFQCGPGKLESITGSGPLYGEFEEERSVIGGQWSTSAGKLFSDISETFPEAAQDPQF